MEQTLAIQLAGSMFEITDLRVWVSNGLFYIDGCVPDWKRKKQAADAAGSTVGARKVINMLRVTPKPVAVGGPVD